MYNFKKIEKKWREYWEKNETFKTDIHNFNKPKFYCLDMFPYPSGSGLHIGHPEGYTATDIISRMKRMQGFNVLHPMGFDAFGLPAEQYAIETGNNPTIITKKNIETFTEQLKTLGFSYDWSKCVSTCDPKYYKWTQWIFKQLYLDGLAKNIDMPVNWCEGLGCVLANDEIIDGKSERGCYPVVRKNMKQWVIDMPRYAEKLLNGLDIIDWPNSTKEIQRNWIGKSIGAEVIFKIKDTDYTFKVFTTRCDTLFGATYCVLAPEHELIGKIVTKEQSCKVLDYQMECCKKSDLERTELNKEKTGVFTGAYAINPVNNKEIPIWISDYVLVSYGTGAIMAVPAHDERDYEFAKKFNLDIIPVISESTGIKKENEKKKNSIIAVVYNPKTNKYLTLNWQNLGGRLFIGGTIHDNETTILCALREIKEETGFSNLKLIKESFPIDHHYFAYNKNEAYNINVTGLLFELIDETKTENNLDEDEKDKFIIEWVSKETIMNEVVDEGHKTIFNRLEEDKAYIGDGIHINSDFINNLNKEEAINKMIFWLEENKCGSKKVNYKIREWIFARQRYWGEPIPIINYENGTNEALKDEDLPLVLPELIDYAPCKNGDSPLERAKDWVNITYHGQKGKRETSTMPGSAGSSWYYLRYIDPDNNEEFANYNLLKHWMPVDLYIGGPEHAVGHLLYSRMWNNYLYDKGLVPCSEPFKKLIHQGMILGANGIKMGKRYPEFVINPTDIARDYGADTLRLYEMFMGPLEADKPWSTEGIEGAKKFVDKIWRLYMEDNIITDNNNFKLETSYHQTVKKVTNDYETININTAISQMMIFINNIYKEKEFPKEYAIGLLKLLNPVVPFITEEIWEEKFNKTSSLALENWPIYDESKTIIDEFEIGVQVNGKLRGSIKILLNEEESSVKEKAFNNENVKKYIENKEILKTIIVPNKIVNIIVK